MSANPKSDPYRQFHFRLTWRGKVTAGFSDVSGLTDSVGPVNHRDGDEANRPRSKFEAITLQRGVTHDTEFSKWADQSLPGGHSRDNIRIDLMNERGSKTATFKICRAWVSKFSGSPDLDANANAVVIEQMTLEHEGCEEERE
jgi:phage tail-like protein